MTQSLQYCRAESLPDAVAMLRAYAGTAKIICGGTDVMVQIKEGSPRMRQVRYLIDISRIPELREIRAAEDGTVRIGAAVTHTEIAESARIRETACFLSEASASVGSLQIRNSGTIGGNICNASLAADTLSPLVALNAKARIVSARGERYMAVQDIMRRGGQNALEADELLCEVEFEPLENYCTAFIKLGRRKALAISRMNVAAAVLLRDGVIADVRLAPGCVFALPDHAVKAERLLTGKRPAEELAVEAGKLVSAEMIERTGVRWSTEYKQPAIEALSERALKQIFERLAV